MTQPYGTPPPGVHPQVPMAPPPADEQWQPARVDPVPGTDFGLVQLRVDPVTSGRAAGSLVAGIAAVLVSLLVPCFGIVGAVGGWSGWVVGAFTLLTVLAGGGAVALGLLARRQIARAGAEGRLRFTGRGQALAGIWCGAAAAGIALLSLVLSLVVQFSR